MTGDPGTWSARVEVRTRDASFAGMLERSLRPEAEREVPRARAGLSRPSAQVVALTIATRDLGAMRAALNTYLGWVALSLAALRSARGPRRSASSVRT
jgi:tRNA threonylcarbamoyladenosine modification (KEOPS) complex  Pcc1 subunit